MINYDYQLQSVISKMLEMETPELLIPTAHQLASAHFE